jgi:hypothetical protein
LRSLAFRGLELHVTEYAFFRFAENTNEGITGKSVSIVHTPAALRIRRLAKLPQKTTA